MRSIGMALALSAIGASSAFADDRCSDPLIADSVKKQVICTQLIRCDQYGGYDAVLNMTPEKYMDWLRIHGWKRDGSEREQIIFRNAYRHFGIRGIVESADTIPASYDSAIGRTECRMTVHWKMPEFKTTLSGAVYIGLMANPQTRFSMMVIGSDAGWSFMRNYLQIDRRVRTTTLVKYGIVGDRFEIEQIGQLWDEPENR